MRNKKIIALASLLDVSAENVAEYSADAGSFEVFSSAGKTDIYFVAAPGEAVKMALEQIADGAYSTPGINQLSYILSGDLRLCRSASQNDIYNALWNVFHHAEGAAVPILEILLHPYFFTAAEEPKPEIKDFVSVVFRIAPGDIHTSGDFYIWQCRNC